MADRRKIHDTGMGREIMAQRLYLSRKDNYRLKLKAYDNTVYEEMRTGDSKHKYAFSIKEKLSEEPIERFVSCSDGNSVYFDLCSLVGFGTYLYVIELTDFNGKKTEDLAYGFVDVLPDI
jgi:hypothetical protein